MIIYKSYCGLWKSSKSQKISDVSGEEQHYTLIMMSELDTYLNYQLLVLYLLQLTFINFKNQGETLLSPLSLALHKSKRGKARSRR